MTQESSRRELARFLRSRRERVTPADVGLPAGPRRRSSGLRREEVAVLAGLSPTWYTYLEQGRDIHPSAEVLDSLARVLGLTEDERRYMHLLAHGQVSKPRPLADEVSAEETVRRLVALSEDSPYPVYGMSVLADIIAWNKATTSYYADFGGIPPERRNMVRWMLEAPEAKQRLTDWAEDTRDIVARWRSANAILEHAPEHTERLRRLVAEFTALSPAFARWWDEHDVRERRTRTRRFRHPELGDLTMRLIVVQAADFAPSVVVFHAPSQES
ncbi:MAG TPA: helix-turn-helix transcriptional regulator [Actinophytocola sp.]|uniref:helix-turn-helix transcriptional regulator n=1 Tax=Actinophytocola sp. TaxID=1872138 RepID=UPI002DDD7086|nr:helix-turn-helix transcriptional regulator [Actinophytocola sp.]HEV2780640.1 helix-turn-helix transcriptional regulator [Actinophytocola sp.]